MQKKPKAEPNKRAAVTVGVCTSFITSFFGSALNLSIPDMGAYFNMGAASVGWIITSYMIVVAAFSVPFGKIADSTNRRTVLITGISCFLAASVASVFAPNSAYLIVMRIIQALGASMIFSTNMPIAISAFPPNERGTVIGIVTSSVYVGLALGPVLGGVLNEHFGWRSVFLFGAIICIISLTVTVKGLRPAEQVSAGLKLDVPGNIVFVLMIACIIYGLTTLNTLAFGWAFIAAGIALCVIFAIVELKAENPVIDVRIFTSNLTYTLSNITALFNYSATFALGYLLSIYLQVVMGFSSQTAGFILIAQPFFMAVLSPRMGRLSDRIAPYKLASLGMGLCTLSLLFFSTIKDNTPVWAILISLAVAGVGIAFFSSPNTKVVMECVPSKHFGVANSMLATMRTTGQSTGMAIITLVVSMIVGNISLYTVDHADILATMHTSFTVFTLLCAIGTVFSLVRRKAT